MSRWTDLYPAWWRARYADEMDALLADRPPTVRDRLDLVVGAIDAHLHRPRIGSGWHRRDRARMAGAAALIGAAVWTEAVILSLVDGWDVGLVYQSAVAFLVLSMLCVERDPLGLLRWAAGAIGAYALASLSTSSGATSLAATALAAGAIILAAVPLARTAANVGLDPLTRFALVAWGAVLPVMILVASRGIWFDSAIGPAGWLVASLLWMASWVVVGVGGLRSEEAAVVEAAGEPS